MSYIKSNLNDFVNNFFIRCLDFCSLFVTNKCVKNAKHKKKCFFSYLKWYILLRWQEFVNKNKVV